MSEDLLYAVYQNTKQIRNVTDSMAYLGWCYDIHANRFEEGRKYLLAIKDDLFKDINIMVGSFNGMAFDVLTVNDVPLYMISGFIPIDTLKYVFDYTKIGKK